MWQWPPAEACSLILKGRHIGLCSPSSPSLSLKQLPPAYPAHCVFRGQPGAAFLHTLSPTPLFFTLSSKDAPAQPNGTRLTRFTLER